MIRTPSLRTLELFSILMATRSLTNAAKRVGISQPAASLALKELESQTGLSLFVRSRQRIAPTPQAESLLPHVERLLTQANTVQGQIDKLQGTSASTLHLACIPSFGSTLLPQTISGFKRKQPRVQLRIDIQHLARVLDLVRNETAELGFAYIADTPAPTEHPILTVSLSCLMTKDHPLAAKKAIQISDLSDHTVMMATQGYLPIPAEIPERLRQYNERPSGGLMEVNHVYTAMALAREGIGVALFNPLLLLSGHADNLVGRPFEPSISLTLGALQSSPRNRPPAADTLIDQARVAARNGAKRLRALGIKAEVA